MYRSPPFFLIAPNPSVKVGGTKTESSLSNSNKMELGRQWTRNPHTHRLVTGLIARTSSKLQYFRWAACRTLPSMQLSPAMSLWPMNPVPKQPTWTSLCLHKLPLFPSPPYAYDPSQHNILDCDFLLFPNKVICSGKPVSLSFFLGWHFSSLKRSGL